MNSLPASSSEEHSTISSQPNLGQTPPQAGDAQRVDDLHSEARHASEATFHEMDGTPKEGFLPFVQQNFKQVLFTGCSLLVVGVMFFHSYSHSDSASNTEEEINWEQFPVLAKETPGPEDSSAEGDSTFPTGSSIQAQSQTGSILNPGQMNLSQLPQPGTTPQNGTQDKYANMKDFIKPSMSPGNFNFINGAPFPETEGYPPTENPPSMQDYQQLLNGVSLQNSPNPTGEPVVPSTSLPRATGVESGFPPLNPDLHPGLTPEPLPSTPPITVQTPEVSQPQVSSQTLPGPAISLPSSIGNGARLKGTIEELP